MLKRLLVVQWYPRVVPVIRHQIVLFLRRHPCCQPVSEPVVHTRTRIVYSRPKLTGIEGLRERESPVGPDHQRPSPVFPSSLCTLNTITATAGTPRNFTRISILSARNSTLYPICADTRELIQLSGGNWLYVSSLRGWGSRVVLTEPCMYCGDV